MEASALIQRIENDLVELKKLCAPRPSEPKRLEEKIYQNETADGKFYVSSKVLAEHVAEIAKKHFLSQLEGKEVEEALSITLKHQEYVLDKVPDGLGGYCTNWRYLAKQAIQFIKERILQ